MSKVSELRASLAKALDDWDYECLRAERLEAALRAIRALADKSPCSCEGCECDLGFVVETADEALRGGEG